jgi:hypothetical protein
MTEPVSEKIEKPELCEENVRVLRLGHGANCSSVGSVIDTLFIGAALGGAIFAAVCAAMKNEGVTVVGDASLAGDPGAVVRDEVVREREEESS